MKESSSPSVSISSPVSSSQQKDDLVAANKYATSKYKLGSFISMTRIAFLAGVKYGRGEK